MADRPASRRYGHPVSDKDWRPRYIQVAEALREQITSGRLPPGSPLPSEPQLAQTYKLSRTSVRNAIQELREWGLVRAEQGRGTFVRAPRHRVTRRNAERYQWEKDRVHASEAERRATGGTERDTGLNVDDLEFHAEYEEVDADAGLASAFGVDEGTRLLRRFYWTRPRDEGVPLSLSRSYLRYDHISSNPDLLKAENEPWPGGTQHQLYTVGIELDRIEERITSRPPLPEEAQLLDIESGVSVIAVRRISIDTQGVVVEVADAVYPGDRTEIINTVQLKRWKKRAN
jgi:GntR family transcriptional regulator